MPAAWEAAWGPALFRLEWKTPAGSGSLREPVAPGASAVVTVPRVPPVAFRAVPVWPHGTGPGLAPGESLCYAGALWPTASQASGSRLELSFERGSAVDVVWRLLEARVDLRDFAVDRLQYEIARRLVDDPWSLDVDRVVAAISRRAMRESYVRGVETVEVTVIAPPGRWLASSPFAVPLAGGGTISSLPVGVTTYYSPEGGRWVVEAVSDGRTWSSVP